MTNCLALLILVLLIVGVLGEEGVVFVDRVGSSRGWGFQGQLWSNSSIVTVSPEIRTAPIKNVSKSMAVCGYTVHHDSVTFFPFIVLLIDKQRGLAQIRLKSNLPRESLNTLYTFQIEAYDCDPLPHFSERKFVLVEVKTNIKPTFKFSSYHFSVKVNSPIGSKVGTISAYERPEQSKLGICKYKIVSSSIVPFSINEYGILTTQMLTLDKIKSKRYIFNVDAIDCQKPKPKTSSVPVMVDVFDDCSPHWTGLPSTVDYDEAKGLINLVSTNLAAPSLHLCSVTCQDLLAIITIRLQGKDIRPASSNFCKQDKRSLKRQEMLCDISTKGVNILEMASEFMRDERYGGYYFNANSAIKVNSNSYNFGHFLTRKFTIMFWMKHANMEVRGMKEQILCNTDVKSHNRHHFSLFLHNCKLILLFRKEFGEASQKQYEPTEWRYGPLKEVCDDKWHHYAVLFNDGELLVQIDGEMTTAQSQHLDDKPLSASPAGMNDTRLTVGACFHAKTDTFVQYFKGNLASLKVLDGHLEAINNIRCIATCGEALLLPHIMDVVGFQSSITILSDSVVIRSHDIFNLLKMFSGLSYINTELLNEVHGKEVINRTVTIDTDINCDGTQLQKPQLRSITMHLRNEFSSTAPAASYLRISIHKTVQGYQDERIPLFPNMRFIQDKIIEDNIKSCIIRPVGDAIEPWEYLDWPIPSVINFHLTGLNNSHGLVLEGKQLTKVYELILSNIYYVTRRYEASKPERKFAISCSYANKIVMIEQIVTVELKQNDLKTYYIVDDPVQSQVDQPEGVHQQGKDGKIGFQEKEVVVPKVVKKSVIANTALWVILGCLSVVVVIAFFGFLIFYKKIKRQNNYKSQRKTVFNMGTRRLQSKIKLTSNPLTNEGVMIEEHEMEDDQSMTNEVPDSEEEYGNDLEDYDDEEYKERMIRNVFPRIPPDTISHSVSV